MRTRRRHKRPCPLLDLYACFLLPVCTLLFAGRADWFSTNFSARAALDPGYYRSLFLWGLLICAYHLVLLSRLAGSLSALWLRLPLHLLTVLACCSLLYAIALPYLPARFPRQAHLHTLLACTACLLLMLLLLLLLLAFRRTAPGPCAPYFLGWLAIALCCAWLFRAAGIISCALEIFFSLSTTLFTRSLWLFRLRESPHRSPSTLPLRGASFAGTCGINADGQKERSIGMQEKKRLYKTEGSDKMLCGVCGGIAEYFDIDPTLIRIGWVLATFAHIGLLAYIACAIIMPNKSKIYPDL